MNIRGLYDMGGRKIIEAASCARDNGLWVVWRLLPYAFDGIDIFNAGFLGEGSPSCHVST